MRSLCMDPRISRLKTPQECKTVELRALEHGELRLANDARKRSVQLRAEERGAGSDVERACLEAVFAYEEVQSAEKGKRVRANRTWPMLETRGILPSVERIVLKRSESMGYSVLVAMGMAEFAFEAVILRFPECFSAEAVRRSKERLEGFVSTSDPAA